MNTKRILGFESRWVVGVDLGKQRDYSAVAALEVFDATYDERDRITHSFISERLYRLRGVERVRLGTPYPDVVQRLRDVVSLPQIAGKCTLVLDATGVGMPVVDLLRAARPGCRIVPVTITGGLSEGSDGSAYRVPKRDLLTGLQVLIEQKRLEVAERSRAAGELMTELAEMKSSTASATHDDLVMALALAWWWVRKMGPQSCWGAAA